MVEGNQARMPQYVDYLMIAKYVELIADHATNIAQWVLFVVRNELKSVSTFSKPPIKRGGGSRAVTIALCV